MTCAHCCATERKFSRAVADQDRRRYQRHGPDVTTTAIINSIKDLEPPPSTLLDVGSGIGVIAHELVGDGHVNSAVLVDAASANLDAARAVAQDRKTVSRLRFVHGDFVENADETPAADVVTLDRVVCCYPDYRALLSGAAAKCRKGLAVSYPRDRWYVRLVFVLQNLGRRVKRDRFRTFVHPPEELRRVLIEAGLTLSRQQRTVAWAVELYVRPGGAAGEVG